MARLVVDRWLLERRPAPDLADRLVCAWREISATHTPLPDERLDLVWVDDGSLWLSGPETTSWSHDARELAERVAAHPDDRGRLRACGAGR